jgi:hypothetical protein
MARRTVSALGSAASKRPVLRRIPNVESHAAQACNLARETIGACTVASGRCPHWLEEARRVK